MDSYVYVLIGMAIVLNIGLLIWMILKQFYITRCLEAGIDQLSSICTYVNELEAQKQIEAQELHPCIGFQIPSSEEYYDDEGRKNEEKANK